MQNLVIDKPYVPVPPYRGRVWPAILARVAPHILRKSYGLIRVDCVHADRLAASIAAGHGVLLAPNHCRDEDPIVLSQLSRAVGSPMFVMASWHLFMQTPIRAFLLRRAGAFSIYREGIDRAAINTAIEILETAERPLVIFPEGFIARTNDRLNEMMDGVGLIARSSAKKRAKLQPAKKVVVHAIAIRYKFHGDIQTAATTFLDEIEARLSWTPQRDMPLIDRIRRVGGALLALKEIEHLGRSQTGDIGDRVAALSGAILSPLEDEWAAGAHDGSTNARVKRLRTAIIPDMLKDLDATERERRWKQLSDMYLASELSHYPPDYVRSNPTPERILETIERFEEDLTDTMRVHGPISATVTVGESIEVNPNREGRGVGADPLLQQVDAQLRAMLGISTTGAA